ncbi:hypothetical protein [Hydrogenimonas sp.]
MKRRRGHRVKKSVTAAMVLAMLSLGGCGHKNEVSEIFSPDTIYEKALVYTREDQLVRELETKAAITATLLNEVFPDKYPYDKGVFFFVGVVTSLTLEDFKKNYHITLNGQKPLSITPVKTTDDLYRLIPNVNRWGKYFLIQFPPTRAKKLVIDFGVYPYGDLKLPFERPTRR